MDKESFNVGDVFSFFGKRAQYYIISEKTSEKTTLSLCNKDGTWEKGLMITKRQYLNSHFEEMIADNMVIQIS